jgi:non-ribosomal peptide synthetase component F
LQRRAATGDVVALLFAHGANALAAMLAVLKAGKCYVVLDPAYPPERLSYMLDDSGARVVVTDTKQLPLAARLSQQPPVVVNIDALDDRLADGNAAAYPSPDSLSMLVYTSGSTGAQRSDAHPSHRAGRSSQSDQCVACRSAGSVVALHVIELRQFGAHDLPGIAQRRAVYPYDLKTLGFDALPNWLQSNRITIVRTVPTVFRNFMATLPRGCVFPDVRLLSIGGEPVYGSDVEAFNEHFTPGCTIAHGLGPTECFMVCMQLVAHGSRVEGGKLDIGWPLPGKEIYLLDEHGREVGAGEVARSA